MASAVVAFLPQHVLKRIKALSFINAVTYVNENLDPNFSPYILKDNFAAKGLPLTCASGALRNFNSPYDSTVATRLRNKGYDVIGKSNLDEFGMGSGTTDSIFGPVKNPWSLMSPLFAGFGADDWKRPDQDFVIAGGSSGGSAAAVAANLTSFAIGSDTGGSIRLPAAFCGVLGFKPSYGVISRYGLVALANSFDTPGIFARNVETVREIFEILSDGNDEYDSTCDTSNLNKNTSSNKDISYKPIRIGIPVEYHVKGISNEIISTWDEIAELFHEKLGWEIFQCSLPSTKHTIPCYSILSACDVLSNMARYDGIEFGSRVDESSLETSGENIYASTRSQFLSQAVKGRIFAGNSFALKQNYDRFYLQALKVRNKVFLEFRSCFESNKFDALLTPMSLDVAPLHSDFTGMDSRAQVEKQDVLASGVNLAGLPACSFPVKLSDKSKLPLSLQLIAPFGNDYQLLNILQSVHKLVNFDYSVLDEKLEKFQD